MLNAQLIHIDDAIIETINQNGLDISAIPEMVATLYKGENFEWIPERKVVIDSAGIPVVLNPNIRGALEKGEKDHPFRIQMMHHIFICYLKIIEQKGKNLKGALADHQKEILSFAGQFQYYDRNAALRAFDIMSQGELDELFRLFAETRYILKDGVVKVNPDVITYNPYFIKIVDHLDDLPLTSIFESDKKPKLH